MNIIETKVTFWINNVESIYLEMGVIIKCFKHTCTAIKMLRIIFSNTRQILYSHYPLIIFHAVVKKN